MKKSDKSITNQPSHLTPQKLKPSFQFDNITYRYHINHILYGPDEESTLRFFESLTNLSKFNPEEGHRVANLLKFDTKQNGLLLLADPELAIKHNRVGSMLFDQKIKNISIPGRSNSLSGALIRIDTQYRYTDIDGVSRLSHETGHYLVYKKTGGIHCDPAYYQTITWRHQLGKVQRHDNLLLQNISEADLKNLKFGDFTKYLLHEKPMEDFSQMFKSRLSQHGIQTTPEFLDNILNKAKKLYFAECGNPTRFILKNFIEHYPNVKPKYVRDAISHAFYFARAEKAAGIFQASILDPESPKILAPNETKFFKQIFDEGLEFSRPRNLTKAHIELKNLNQNIQPSLKNHVIRETSTLKTISMRPKPLSDIEALGRFSWKDTKDTIINERFPHLSRLERWLGLKPIICVEDCVIEDHLKKKFWQQRSIETNLSPKLSQISAKIYSADGKYDWMHSFKTNTNAQTELSYQIQSKPVVENYNADCQITLKNYAKGLPRIALTGWNFYSNYEYSSEKLPESFWCEHLNNAGKIMTADFAIVGGLSYASGMSLGYPIFGLSILGSLPDIKDIHNQAWSSVNVTDFETRELTDQETLNNLIYWDHPWGYGKGLNSAALQDINQFQFMAMNDEKLEGYALQKIGQGVNSVFGYVRDFITVNFKNEEKSSSPVTENSNLKTNSYKAETDLENYTSSTPAMSEQPIHTDQLEDSEENAIGDIQFETIKELERLQNEIKGNTAQLKAIKNHLIASQNSENQDHSNETNNKKSQSKKEPNKFLPIHLAKAGYALANACFQCARINHESAQFEEYKTSIIRNSEQAFEDREFVKELNKLVYTPIPLAQVYQTVSKKLYDSVYRSIAEQEACFNKLNDAIENAKGRIASRKKSVSQCADLINNIQTEKTKLFNKLERLSYHLTVPYISVGAQALSKIFETANPTLSTMFAITSTIANIFSENKTEKIRKKATKISAKIDSLDKLQQKYDLIIQKNQEGNLTDEGDISQLEDLMLSCGDYLPPEKFKGFLNTNLQRYKIKREESQTALTEAQHTLNGLMQNQFVLKSNNEALTQQLKDQQQKKSNAEQKLSDAKAKKKNAKNADEKNEARTIEERARAEIGQAKNKIKEINKEIDKNEPLLAEATEELNNQRPGLDTTITNLRKEFELWEGKEEQLQDTLNHENEVGTLKSWWHNVRNKLKPNLDGLQQEAEKIHAGFLELLENDTQTIKNMLVGAKNLTTALQRFGIEKPAEYVEVANIALEMYNIVRTFKYCIFEKDGLLSKIKELGSIKEGIKSFGGWQHLFVDVFGISGINFVALGFNLVAILGGFAAKNPVIEAINANFENLYKYLDQHFTTLYKTININDIRVNAKLDDIHQKITTTKEEIIAIKYQIKNLHEKLHSIKENGSTRTNELQQIAYTQANKNTINTYKTTVSNQITEIETLWEKKLSPLEYLNALADRVDHAKSRIFSSNGYDFNPSIVDFVDKPHLYIGYIAKKLNDNNKYINFKIYFSAIRHIVLKLEEVERGCLNANDFNTMQGMSARFPQRLAKILAYGDSLQAFLSQFTLSADSPLIKQIGSLKQAYRSLVRKIETANKKEHEILVANMINASKEYKNTILSNIGFHLTDLTHTASEKMLTGSDKFIGNKLFSELALVTEFDFDKYKKNTLLMIRYNFFIPTFIPFIPLYVYVVSSNISRTRNIFMNTDTNLFDRLNLFKSVLPFEDITLYLDSIRKNFDFAVSDVTVFDKNFVEAETDFLASAFDNVYKSVLKFNQIDNSSLKNVSTRHKSKKEYNFISNIENYPIRVEFGSNGIKINGHPAPPQCPIIKSPFPEEITKITLENNKDIETKRQLIKEFDQKYNESAKAHIVAYSDLVRKLIPLKKLVGIDTSFNNISIKDGELIHSTNDSLYPLIMPGTFLRKIAEDEAIKKLYEDQKNGLGFVHIEYTFNKEKNPATNEDIYKLHLIYHLVEPMSYEAHQADASSPITYLSSTLFEVASFDAVTVESFNKFGKTASVNINEFLLIAMYGSPEHAGLAGKDTYVFPGSGLICPAELPFIGIYSLLEKIDSKFVINFDHRKYDEQMIKDINYFINDKENINIIKDFINLREPVELLNNQYSFRGLAKQNFNFEEKFLDEYQKIEEEYNHLLAQFKLVTNIDDESASLILKERLNVIHPSEIKAAAKLSDNMLMRMIKQQCDLNISDAMQERFFNFIYPMQSKLLVSLDQIKQNVKNWLNRFVKYNRDEFPTSPMPSTEHMPRRWKISSDNDSCEADDWSARGDLLFAEKNYIDAALCFQKATELAPNEALYLSQLSEALYYQRKYAEAILLLKHAIKLDPTNPSYQYGLQLSLSAQKKHQETQEVNYKIARNPNSFHFSSNKKAISENGVESKTLDVSGIRNSCGLYALALGIKISFKRAPELLAKFQHLDFIQNMQEASLQTRQGTADTSKNEKLLRSHLRTALLNDKIFKGRRSQDFIRLVADYLDKNTYKEKDMESFYKEKNNDGIIKNLASEWHKINQTLQSSTDLLQYYLDRINQYNVTEKLVEEFYQTLRDSLIKLDRGLCKENAIKLANAIIYLYLNGAEGLIKFKKLWQFSWEMVEESLASPEARRLLKETLDRQLLKLYIIQLQTLPDFLKLDDLIKFALFETIKFSSNIVIDDVKEYLFKTNLLNIYVSLKLENKWNEIYHNYCAYAGSEPVRLSVDELICLAKYWNVQVEIKFANRSYNSYQGSPNPGLPVIKLINKTEDHWQVVVDEKQPQIHLRK